VNVPDQKAKDKFTFKFRNKKKEDELALENEKLLDEVKSLK
jgi:hypothetical protein